MEAFERNQISKINLNHRIGSCVRIGQVYTYGMVSLVDLAKFFFGVTFLIQDCAGRADPKSFYVYDWPNLVNRYFYLVRK